MSFGWEASSLRASIKALVLQKMSCLYEGGGARQEELVLKVYVCACTLLHFWGGPAVREVRRGTFGVIKKELE